MRFTDTRNRSVSVSFQQAIFTGLAESGGLYYADKNPDLSQLFDSFTPQTSFNEIATATAYAFLGDELTETQVGDIVQSAFHFEPKLNRLGNNLILLELFHGPSLSFKDFGASFLAASMEAFLGKQSRHAVILTATSGDTGSAVAQAFYKKANIDVVILYPSEKVSPLQEKQLTTLGENIHALEVRGTFDDCQRLVKNAFGNTNLRKSLNLTSANSINLGRLTAQTFYYIWARSQLKTPKSEADDLTFTVPSGNFGNLTAGLIAAGMGLPVKHFIAANNVNDVFLEYLQTGRYSPRVSVRTIANAMDVGDPSNLARIVDLYKGSVSALREDVSGYSFTDDDIRNTISEVYLRTGYVADPHGACSCRGLMDSLRPGQTGVFLETAHPAKFKDTVGEILGTEIQIPERLMAFLDARKQSVKTGGKYDEFKEYLLSRC